MVVIEVGANVEVCSASSDSARRYAPYNKSGSGLPLAGDNGPSGRTPSAPSTATGTDAVAGAGVSTFPTLATETDAEDAAADDGAAIDVAAGSSGREVGRSVWVSTVAVDTAGLGPASAAALGASLRSAMDFFFRFEGSASGFADVDGSYAA
jgi:hypothetical protein